MDSRHFFEAEAGPRQNCRGDAEAVKAGNEARLGLGQPPPPEAEARQTEARKTEIRGT